MKKYIFRLVSLLLCCCLTALPLSVRFVTSTYQSVLEEETPQSGNEKEAE